MANASRTRNSFLNMLTGIGGQLLITVLKFVTRTVFISTLGKQYLGINGLFTDILTMLSLTELGFDTAINFKLYKPLAEKNTKRVRVLMRFYRQAYTAVGLTILALGLGLTPLLRFLIKDYESLAPLGINAALIFFLFLMQSVSSYLFFAYRSAIIKADQKTYLLNLAGYAVTIVECAVQIAVLLLWKNFLIYTSVIVLFNIVRNLVGARIAQRLYPDVFLPEKERLSREEIRDMFKDCGALLVYKANGVVLKATDNMVLSTFIGLAMVGMYSNYLMFYTNIKMLLSRFYEAVKASMGNLFTVADMEKKYRFFEVMNFLTVVLYGTAGLGVAVLANEVILQWIGDGYVIEQPFAVLMGLEILFVGLKNNLGQVRNITGAFRQMWFRPVLGIIVNLGVSIALVTRLGICGVLIGTIASDCLTYFLVDPAVIYRHSFGGYKPVSDYYKKNLLYILILCAVGLADAWLCRVILPGLGWLSVGVHVAICGCSVPAAFLLLFRGSEECAYLIDLGRRVGRKLMRKVRRK